MQMKYTLLRLSLSNCPMVVIVIFRDRIIHLLAVRSYKRPELLIRLRKGKTCLLCVQSHFLNNSLLLAVHKEPVDMSVGSQLRW